MSLLMQSIMMPMNAYELVLVKKYILGVTSGPDGALLYNESFAAPTAEAIALANKMAAEKHAASTGPASEDSRVEELADKVEEEEEKKDTTEEKKKDSKTSAATELD